MRSDLLLTRDEHGYRVSAGDLYGLTPGSILAVESPAGAEAEPRLLGYVRIRATGPFDAAVEPCSHRGSPVVNDFAPLSSCRPVFIDYGLRRLKLALQIPDRLAASRQDLQRALQPIAEEKHGLVEWVKDPREADWLLRPDQHRVELVEASGNHPPFLLPPPESRMLAEELRRNLQTIFRARNLVAVASRSEAERFRGGAGVDVDIQVLLQKELSAPVEIMSIPSGGLVFRPGNQISFRVRNDSHGTRVDVSLLVVGTDFRIHPFYPRANELAKDLDPGETLTTPPGEIDKRPPFGPECLVVIAVPARNPPLDFTYLAQGGVPLARDGASDRKVRSPLQDLLETAMFQTGTRRGALRVLLAADQYGLRMLTWRTEPR
jgi:hypothetical protein